MDHKELNEDRLKAAFSNFEPKPPDHVWNNLRRELHPELDERANSIRVRKPFLSIKPLYVYISMAAAVLLFLIIVVYVSAYDHHSIRGFAYAGDAHLCKGTAILFKVEDKALPRDSVHHYKSAIVNKDGFYQFTGVESGNYLLRIIPEKNEHGSMSYLPSWYEQHLNHHDAKMIDVESEDIKADVHLIKDCK